MDRIMNFLEGGFMVIAIVGNVIDLLTNATSKKENIDQISVYAMTNLALRKSDLVSQIIVLPNLQCSCTI